MVVFKPEPADCLHHSPLRRLHLLTTFSLSCALYSENFDDGVANEITSGAYRVRWCNCTGVRVNYSYYQFALANVTLAYRQSNDLNQVCPQSSLFTTDASHFTTQACMQESVLIPFGSASGVYVRFAHGSGSNAMWLDNITLTLEGCSSC